MNPTLIFLTLMWFVVYIFYTVHTHYQVFLLKFGDFKGRLLYPPFFYIVNSKASIVNFKILISFSFKLSGYIK